MKALSIRQPWAWAVTRAGKRIETRTAWTNSRYRGPLLIHAAKGMTRDEYDDAIDFMVEDAGVPRIITPHRESLIRGAIIGRCDVVDVIERGASEEEVKRKHGEQARWWMGGFALVLDNVEHTRIVPFTGMLGFFEVPDDVVARLR